MLNEFRVKRLKKARERLPTSQPAAFHPPARMKKSPATVSSRRRT